MTCRYSYSNFKLGHLGYCNAGSSLGRGSREEAVLGVCSAVSWFEGLMDFVVTEEIGSSGFWVASLIAAGPGAVCGHAMLWRVPSMNRTH